jgi:hypothetical protein
MGRKKTDPVQDTLDEIAEAKKTGAVKLSILGHNLDVVRAACEVTTVKDLRISGSLTELPEELGNLSELEGLSLESNALKTLPAAIGKLTKLTDLRAYSNKMKSLPPEIGALTKLRIAVLWSNELTELPPEIGNWSSIVELELKWNKLKKLPDELGKLSTLEKLELESNELTELPLTLGGMTKLYRLTLGTNKFSKFPLGVLDLPALRELELKENKIKELPDDLARLTRLEELDLSENEISKLGTGIYELRALTSLKLGNNKLTSITKDFGKLRSLTTLELEDNAIAGFSEETLAIGKDAVFEQLGLSQKVIVEGDLPEDAAALAKAAKERFDQFERACRKKSHAREMLPKLIAFFSGKTNEVPPIRRDDNYGFSHLPEHLAKFADWTFIDRRMVRYIAGPAFYYRQPGHDYYTGYYEEFYAWLKPQLKAEAPGGDLFTRIVDLIRSPDLDDELILRSSLRELDEEMMLEDGSPTSYGRWLIDQAATRIEVIGEMGATYSGVRDGVIGLFVKHAFDQFAKIADKLLSLDPDDDGEIHAPHGAYDKLCAVDPVKYTPMVLDAVDKAKCLACQAELAKILTERCGPAHRARAFEVATGALALLSERKNQDGSLWFPFDGRYGDSSSAYVDFVLRNFGREAKDAIFKFAENTKVFDLDVAEVIARYLGQDGIDALAEGLNMSFDDDSIAPHFRRMFAMLAPLEWSKYRDKAWELARSEQKQVRQTACMALARLDAKEVLPKALELIAEKKAHLREAGVMIATLLDGDPAAKTLDGLLATEPNDDVRDLIVARRYGNEAKITPAEAAKRVASAKARGKLDKPPAKWLDEKKLGTVMWKGGKKLDTDTIRFLMYRQTRLADIAPEPEAHALYALIDRDKSSAFATKLLAGVIKNGGVSAKNRFALSFLGLIGGEDLIETLEEIAIDSTNVNAATTLGLLGSHEAARALDRIMKRFRTKYPNVREAAQDAFDQIAQTLGITRFELADSMIPDLGFTKGEGQITLGKIKARVVIDDDRKLAFYDKDKPIKSPGKGLAGKQKEALEALRDEVDAASRMLKTNLEYYMVGGRRWAADKWKAFFVGNPLAKAFARSLVWNAIPPKGEVTAFRIDATGALLDRDGKPVTLGKDTQVALVHPLDIDANTRAAWQAILDEQNLAPPFAQMTRSVFAPKDDDRTRTISFEFENKELEGLTFKSRAERLGWRRGSVIDGGAVSAYRKLFERHQIEVFIGTENLGVQSYDGGEVTLDQLFFVKAGAVVTGSYTYDEPRDAGDARLIKLGDLPAIVYSEAIADLRAITREVQED